MYTKKHLKTTQKQRGTPSTTPLARTQPLYKVYKGKRTTNYVQLAPGPNITNEEEFQPLNQLSLIVKCLLFFSFQTVQKRHKGAARHAYFLFLPTKKPRHPNKASVTEEGSTHDTPQRENNKL